MDAQVRRTLRQTAYVAARKTSAGPGAYGDLAYDAAAARPCREEKVERIVLTSTGADSKTETMLVFEAEVGPQDRVWLPGAYPSGQAHLPNHVETVRDEAGNVSHCEVYL